MTNTDANGTVGGARSLWPSATRCMEVQTSGTEAVSEAREVIRCVHCSLVQFRTHNNLCRRCWAALDVPVIAPATEEPVDYSREESLPDVAGAIRSLRRKFGLSQRELAQRMRVPRTYVSKIENDKATPTIASLERLAEAMATSVADILTCTGNGGEGVPNVARRPSTEALRALLSDTFVQQVAPYVGQLGASQMNRVLGQLRTLAAARARQ